MIYHWTPIARSVPPGTTLSHMAKGGGTFDPNSLLIPDDYNALYLQAGAEPDFAKATALWQEASKMTMDKYCMSIPVMAPFRYLATTKNVHVDLREYAMGEWLPELAWISK